MPQAPSCVQVVEDTEITVVREGNYTRVDDDYPDEANLFQGDENRLVFDMTYKKQFRCVYQLHTYPFDTQLCSINITLRKIDRTTVLIKPNVLTMLSELTLTKYIISSWKMVYQNESNPVDGIVAVIELKRRVMSEMLTTYLPTILILIIVYSTNFFKPFFFEAIVTVNLTSLLVLTTLFISVTDSLPKTSYVKVMTNISSKTDFPNRK